MTAILEAQGLERDGAGRRRLVAEAVLAALDGDVALFSHGHLLRVLAARWLGLAPESGALFALGTGTLSILGFEREVRVIRRWNAPVTG